MQTNKFWQHIAFTLIALLPLAYLFYAWNDLPAQVATHFGLDGKPNGFTDKADLWAVMSLLSGLALFCYFLLQFINRVDPKRIGKPVPPVIKKIGIIVVLFMTALDLLMLVSAAHPEQTLGTRMMVPLLGLLFVFLGNLIYNIKPNYFVGIRVPWTLASDYNWRKTHQLGGAVWFVCGLIITVTALFIKSQAEEWILQSMIAILIIVPIAYSFILFKKESSDPGYFDQRKP